MMRRKLILIGIDGCTFNILNPLIKDGYLPTFAEILEEGCHSTLISTLPFNTLPAWTSIFTGVNPGKHGITDFVIRENEQLKVVNVQRHRMVNSLWNILSRYNIKQIIVNEPITYPPERINGIMLTGFSTPPNSKNFAYPNTIIDEVEKVSNGYQPDLPFGFEKVIAEDKSKGYQLISEFSEKILKVSKYLHRNYDWDLLAIIITSTDRLQHFYFDDIAYIRDHYKRLDDFLKDIINTENEANIIIVSDHGFGPIIKCFYINTWLKKEGLVVDSNSLVQIILSTLGLTYPKIISALLKFRLYKFLAKIVPQSIKREIPRDRYSNVISFTKSKIIYPSLNGGLFVNDPNLNINISRFIEKLSSLKINDEIIIERVLRRDEVIWGPYSYRAPDIFVIPRYGYEISHRLVPDYLSPPSRFGDIRTGTHRPDGVFIAYGPDINRGIKLKKPLFTWDITPLILHMLDIPIPQYMDGSVRKEIFSKNSKLAMKHIKFIGYRRHQRIKTRLKALRNKYFRH